MAPKREGKRPEDVETPDALDEMPRNPLGVNEAQEMRDIAAAHDSAARRKLARAASPRGRATQDVADTEDEP